MKLLFFALIFCLLFAVGLPADDTAKVISGRDSEVVSLWDGVVPLRNKQVLAVELQLYANRKASYTEKYYKNWGHYHNKRKPLRVVESRGSYEKVIRKEVDGVTSGGKPWVEVTVVGLQIGDWKMVYGDRKGNRIMRFKKSYAATLFIDEKENITTKVEQGGAPNPLPATR